MFKLISFLLPTSTSVADVLFKDFKAVLSAIVSRPLTQGYSTNPNSAKDQHKTLIEKLFKKIKADPKTNLAALNPIVNQNGSIILHVSPNQTIVLRAKDGSKLTLKTVCDTQDIVLQNCREKSGAAAPSELLKTSKDIAKTVASLALYQLTVSAFDRFLAKLGGLGFEEIGILNCNKQATAADVCDTLNGLNKKQQGVILSGFKIIQLHGFKTLKYVVHNGQKWVLTSHLKGKSDSVLGLVSKAHRHQQFMIKDPSGTLSFYEGPQSTFAYIPWKQHYYELSSAKLSPKLAIADCFTEDGSFQPGQFYDYMGQFHAEIESVFETALSTKEQQFLNILTLPIQMLAMLNFPTRPSNWVQAATMLNRFTMGSTTAENILKMLSTAASQAESMASPTQIMTMLGYNHMIRRAIPACLIAFERATGSEMSKETKGRLNVYIDTLSTAMLDAYMGRLRFEKITIKGNVPSEEGIECSVLYVRPQDNTQLVTTYCKGDSGHSEATMSLYSSDAPVSQIAVRLSERDRENGHDRRDVQLSSGPQRPGYKFNFMAQYDSEQHTQFRQKATKSMSKFSDWAGDFLGCLFTADGTNQSTFSTLMTPVYDTFRGIDTAFSFPTAAASEIPLIDPAHHSFYKEEDNQQPLKDFTQTYNALKPSGFIKYALVGSDAEPLAHNFVNGGDPRDSYKASSDFLNHVANADEDTFIAMGFSAAAAKQLRRKGSVCETLSNVLTKGPVSTLSLANALLNSREEVSRVDRRGHPYFIFKKEEALNYLGLIRNPITDEKQSLGSFRDFIVSQVKMLESGQSIVVPAGWFGDSGGHAMAIRLSKEAEDAFKCEIINSGAGREALERVSLLSKQLGPVASVSVLSETALSSALGVSILLYTYKNFTLDEHSFHELKETALLYAAFKSKSRTGTAELHLHQLAEDQWGENCYDEVTAHLRQLVEVENDVELANFQGSIIVEKFWRFFHWEKLLSKSDYQIQVNQMLIHRFLIRLSLEINDCPDGVLNQNFILNVERYASLVSKKVQDVLVDLAKVRQAKKDVSVGSNNSIDNGISLTVKAVKEAGIDDRDDFSKTVRGVCVISPSQFKDPQSRLSEVSRVFKDINHLDNKFNVPLRMALVLQVIQSLPNPLDSSWDTIPEPTVENVADLLQMLALLQNAPTYNNRDLSVSLDTMLGETIVGDSTAGVLVIYTLLQRLSRHPSCSFSRIAHNTKSGLDALSVNLNHYRSNPFSEYIGCYKTYIKSLNMQPSFMSLISDSVRYLERIDNNATESNEHIAKRFDELKHEFPDSIWGKIFESFSKRSDIEDPLTVLFKRFSSHVKWLESFLLINTQECSELYLQDMTWSEILYFTITFGFYTLQHLAKNLTMADIRFNYSKNNEHYYLNIIAEMSRTSGLSQYHNKNYGPDLANSVPFSDPRYQLFANNIQDTPFSPHLFQRLSSENQAEFILEWCWKNIANIQKSVDYQAFVHHYLFMLGADSNAVYNNSPAYQVSLYTFLDKLISTSVTEYNTALLTTTARLISQFSQLQNTTVAVKKLYRSLGIAGTALKDAFKAGSVGVQLSFNIIQLNVLFHGGVSTASHLVQWVKITRESNRLQSRLSEGERGRFFFPFHSVQQALLYAVQSLVSEHPDVLNTNEVQQAFQSVFNSLFSKKEIENGIKSGVVEGRPIGFNLITGGVLRNGIPEARIENYIADVETFKKSVEKLLGPISDSSLQFTNVGQTADGKFVLHSLSYSGLDDGSPRVSIAYSVSYDEIFRRLGPDMFTMLGDEEGRIVVSDTGKKLKLGGIVVLQASDSDRIVHYEIILSSKKNEYLSYRFKEEKQDGKTKYTVLQSPKDSILKTYSLPLCIYVNSKTPVFGYEGHFKMITLEDVSDFSKLLTQPLLSEAGHHLWQHQETGDILVLDQAGNNHFVLKKNESQFQMERLNSEGQSGRVITPLKENAQDPVVHSLFQKLIAFGFEDADFVEYSAQTDIKPATVFLSKYNIKLDAKMDVVPPRFYTNVLPGFYLIESETALIPGMSQALWFENEGGEVRVLLPNKVADYKEMSVYSRNIHFPKMKFDTVVKTPAYYIYTFDKYKQLIAVGNQDDVSATIKLAYYYLLTKSYENAYLLLKKVHLPGYIHTDENRRLLSEIELDNAYKDEDIYAKEVQQLASAVRFGRFITEGGRTSSFLPPDMKPVSFENLSINMHLPSFDSETATRRSLQAFFHAESVKNSPKWTIALPTVKPEDESFVSEYQSLLDTLSAQTQTEYTLVQGVDITELDDKLTTSFTDLGQDIKTIQAEISEMVIEVTEQTKSKIPEPRQKLLYTARVYGETGWGDLIQLASNANLDLYKRRFPYLAEKDCLHLHDLITSMMSKFILKSQLKQAQKALANGYIQAVGEELHTPIFHRNEPIVASVLSLESDRDWNLRENQWEMLNAFLKYVKQDNDGLPFAWQELMGGGKTAVLLLTAQHLTSTSQAVCVMTTDALLGQTAKELARGMSVSGRSVYIFSPDPQTHSTVDHARDYFEQTVTDLKYAVENGYPIMLSKTSYQLFLTLRTNALKKYLEDPENSGNQLEIYNTLHDIGLIFKNSVMLQDEFDTLWDVSNDLKLSQGEDTAISKDQVDFTFTFMQVIAEHVEVGTFKEASVVIKRDENGMPLAVTFIGAEKKQYQNKLKDSVSGTLTARIFQKYFKKAPLSKKNQALIQKFLLGKCKKTELKELIGLTNSINNPELMRELKLIKAHLDTLTLESDYLKDFGYPVREDGSIDEDKQDLPILPYKKAMTPFGEDTRYSDKTIEKMLSYNALVQAGIRAPLLVNFAKVTLSKLGSAHYGLAYQDHIYSRLATWLPDTISVGEDTFEIRPKNEEKTHYNGEVIFQFFSRIVNDADFSKNIIKSGELPNSSILYKQLFTAVIAPNIQYQPVASMSLPHDLQEANSFRASLVTSGTSYGSISWAPHHHKLNKKTGTSIAAIMGVPTHSPVSVFDTADETLSGLIKTLADGEGDSVIIDVAGELTISTKALTEQLFAQNPNIQEIAYFTNGEELKVTNPSATGSKHVIIYNHIDTVGRDRKNPTATNSKVLVSAQNSLEDLHQGIMRVREHKQYIEKYLVTGDDYMHDIQLVLTTDLDTQIRSYFDLSTTENVKIRQVESYLLILDQHRQMGLRYQAIHKRVSVMVYQEAELLLNQYAKLESSSDAPLKALEMLSEAARIRDKKVIGHPGDLPLVSSQMSAYLQLESHVENLKNEFPNIIKGKLLTAINAVLTPVKSALSKKEIVVKQVEKDITTQRQKETNTEKAKATETTDHFNVSWGIKLAEKKVWHPADVKKKTFLEDEALFVVASSEDYGYDIDTLPEAFGKTIIYNSRNLRCPLKMYGCVSSETQLLHPHKVMVLQYPKDSLKYVLLSDEETVMMEEAIRNGDLGDDVFIMLINIENPTFKLDWSTQAGSEDKRDKLFEDQRFHLELIKIQMSAGILPLSELELATRSFLTKLPVPATPELLQSWIKSLDEKQARELHRWYKIRSKKLYRRDVFEDSSVAHLFHTRLNKITESTV